VITSLYTKNCIVTGMAATCWSGHVMLDELYILNQVKLTNVRVIAGFVNLLTMERAKSNNVHDGCWGLYKPEYGIVLRRPLEVERT